MTSMIRRVLVLSACAAVLQGCKGDEAAMDEMVEEILPRLERLSGLEALEPIRMARQDSASVRAYVERQLDEELPREVLDGIHATYVALGLIPDTLDLRALLLNLYSEQVVGYYDPRNDTFYLVEGRTVAEMGPVLAHELVHALQDQHADLEALISREQGNDRQTAAQSAIEGHATLVMFALLLEAESGGELDLSRLPDMSAQLRPLLEAQNEAFPVFRSAPRVIRQTLIFPYIGGASFVQALWREKGRGPDGRWPAPLDSLLPVSTEQVLHPADRFFGVRDLPTEIELGEVPAGWQTLYENTLGELELSIFLTEHLGWAADTAAVGWDGDRFRMLEGPSGERALVWYSVWDDTASADAFAESYRRILEVRPDRRGRVRRMEVRGRPVVLVVDAEAGVELDSVPVPEILALEERA